MPAVATPARAPLRAALVAALALAAGACGGPADDPSPPTPSSPTAAAPEGDGVAARGTGAGAYEVDRADVSAIERMLAARAEAVRLRDREAFLATVDDRDPRTMAQQRTLFDNLARLRLSGFAYETTTDQLLPDEVRGASPRDPVVRLQTVEHVRVADALSGPVGNEVEMTYVRRDGSWLVGREVLSADDGVDLLRPWFGVPIAVADRGSLVVLADASDEELAESLADVVEEAVTADAALLQVTADDQVLVDATSNGTGVDLNTVDAQEAAAVYTGVSDVDAQGRRAAPAGSAIRVNPDLSADELLGDPGLVRHEVVHLLLREYTGVVPMWLSEGVAEYARWYPLTTEDLEITPGLGRAVDAAPRALPGAGVFQLEPSVNYLVSQAAAQHLFSLGGATSLRALLDRYREGAAAPGDAAFGEGLTPRLLREVYGISEADLVDGTWAALGELTR